MTTVLSTPAPAAAAAVAAGDRFTLTVRCPTTRGIVAAISTYLADSGCNITDSAQFDDQLTGTFFMRVSVTSQTGSTIEDLRDGFTAISDRFGMDHAFHDDAVKTKVIVMVSRFGH
ncbi:ACT domain-containing protein [Caenispirillum bisanense]|uniref:Formyltetrahydrofolate deformylase n=1 Tax=Caenispirillum bisanense TaxID=414052 RepID=A0A286G8P5_9PROT|nr:ACT domain-containing protein [Caenispirillum bisanense]SOD91868.1 formyltetrahydrofolate deformylase [Caenispirillum bisanense]